MALQGLYECFNHWGKDGGTFIISDTHFGEDDLKKVFPNRPSDDELVRMINQKVGKNGTLILLGDVGDIEFARKLKGYKILVCGNHDRGNSNYQRQVVSHKYDQKDYTRQEAMNDMAKKYPNWKLTCEEGYDFHSPFTYWKIIADNNLFNEVYDGPVMISGRILLSHEPVPNITWAVNLHGHVHDPKARSDKYHFNMCADRNNYTPINFNQWLKDGHLSHIVTTRRVVIDGATERKRKRGGKKIGEK